MSNTIDHSILPLDHFESIEMDLIKRQFSPDALGATSTDHSAELESLRDFNAQLLERIGQMRSLNLELSGNEENLKSQLTALEKQLVEKDRALASKASEARAFKNACDELRAESEKAKTESSRKLAKLTDDNWSIDLELKNVKKTEAEQSDEIQRLTQELSTLIKDLEALRAREGDAVHELKNTQLLLEKAQKKIIEQETAIDERDQHIKDARAVSEEALTAARDENTRVNELFKTRETQLVTAFENLRAEYSSIDKCYKETVASATALKAQVRATELEKERALSEFQSRLSAEFHTQINAALMENSRLKQMLEARHEQHDLERGKLQTWREQLDFLDRHLRQVSDALKRGKMESLKIAKTLSQEIHVARSHPIKEYLEGAQLEITNLERQMTASSSLSPTRQKLEVRLAQTIEYRDALKQHIENVEKQFSDRSQTIKAIIASLT